MSDFLPRGNAVHIPSQRSALARLCLLFLLAASVARAQQYTESVLYTFPNGCSFACNANQGLIQDVAGNLYGTALNGGTYHGGIVFKLDPKGVLTVLHNFSGQQDDGGGPYAGVIMDKAGNLYGTTQGGGKYNNGTVYKMTKGGRVVVLHSFGNGADGMVPWSGLTMDALGNLYGTTIAGGIYKAGTVFKITKTGQEKVMHSFGNPNSADGNGPLWETLIFDNSGNLYGTTQDGGRNGFGVVFKLSKSGTETIVHYFGFNDGEVPDAGLFRDKAGSLYGTTYVGGNDGVGTIYGITNHKETILYSFTDTNGDGETPVSGLVGDDSGNLYGTTYYGGMQGCYDGNEGGCGTVFKLDTHHKETILYEFTGGNDGAYPGYGNLLRDAKGNLYGATRGYPSGASLIFKLTPK